MNFIWSLRGPARTSSCGASRPARDDDHDPAPLGPLGLVQLVSVVRVHDGRPFVGEVSPCHPDDERHPPPWTPRHAAFPRGLSAPPSPVYAPRQLERVL